MVEHESVLLDVWMACDCRVPTRRTQATLSRDPRGMSKHPESVWIQLEEGVWRRLTGRCNFRSRPGGELQNCTILIGPSSEGCHEWLQGSMSDVFHVFNKSGRLAENHMLRTKGIEET